MACVLAGLSALPAAATDPRHRIAIALPLTGPHRALGAEIKAAVELIMVDATAKSGAPGLLLTWHDDQCSSAGGLTAAQSIAAAAPAVVIGHGCPSAAQAAAPVYAAAGLVFIASGQLPSRASAARRSGPLHFRMQADGDQGTLIGTTIADAGPDTRIALIRDKTQFAQSALQMTAAALSARGRTPVLVETFAGGDKDFAVLAQRLKAGGVTHIALAAFPSEASLLVTEVRKAMPEVTILATDTLADPAFARAAGLAANGVQVALAPDARAFPGAQAMVTALVANGAPPRRPALSSAAALELVSAALARAPSSDLARTLATQPFETILGALSFDANGVARLPAQVLYTWSDGVLRPPAR